ncbi:MAG: cation:proton antiporter [Minisyncoccia bacterium]
MEYIQLMTMLVSIVFASKIIAKFTKTVDILWYILLGLVGTQYIFHIDPVSLENWATMGVIFIMFYTGWREDLFTFIFDLWKNKWIAVAGALGPFIGAFLAYNLLQFSIQQAIVAGFIFTSTAIPYTVGVLRSAGLDKTRAAKAVTSASVTDNLISVLLAVGMLPAYALLVQSSGDVSFGEIWIDLFKQIGLIFAAFGIFGILGIFVLPGSRMKLDVSIPDAFQRGFWSRITYQIYKLRKLPGFHELSRLLGSVRIGFPLIFLMVFGLALVAHKLGLHPAITAYLTGLVLHTEMFDIDTVTDIETEEMPINHKNLGIFFYFLQEWIGPIFFIHLGSQLVADWSQAWHIIVYGAIAGSIIAFFQFMSAYWAAKYNSKLPNHESMLVGFAMIPYDIIAFVVLGIATGTGLVAADSPFTISIVASIIVLNIIATIGIYKYKPRYLRKQAEYEASQNKQK